MKTTIFDEFKSKFGVPLNKFLKRVGPLITFDSIAFDKWIAAGAKSTVSVADEKFGAGAGDLLLRVVNEIG